MRLAKVCVLVWSLAPAFVASAASEQELFRAAKRGDVAGIQAALRAGANINTRFDIGKTALIVAAENGRDAAVEVLMDTGADLYALDNNKWDALTHASESERISTLKLLLRKGYDPSKNNWLALSVMRSQNVSRPIIRSGNPRLLEANKILENAYKSSGGGAVGGFSGGSSPVTARVGVREDAAEPILIDVSERKVTLESFKSAATKAFSQRGWTIVTSEPEQITGAIKEYRARISFKSGALIKIAFVEGYGQRSPNWLLNLKKDLEQELSTTPVR